MKQKVGHRIWSLGCFALHTQFTAIDNHRDIEDVDIGRYCHTALTPAGSQHTNTIQKERLLDKEMVERGGGGGGGYVGRGYGHVSSALLTKEPRAGQPG